jgi:hypothetical protein
MAHPALFPNITKNTGGTWRLNIFLRRSRAGVPALLGVITFTFGCTKKEPTVVIDDWWNVDFAKNGCDMRARNGDHPCIGDPTAEVRDFEAQLRTAFASDGSCHGVGLADFQGPNQAASKAASKANTSKADWQLMLDLVWANHRNAGRWCIMRRQQRVAAARGK